MFKCESMKDSFLCRQQRVKKITLRGHGSKKLTSGPPRKVMNLSSIWCYDSIYSTCLVLFFIYIPVPQSLKMFRHDFRTRKWERGKSKKVFNTIFFIKMFFPVLKMFLKALPVSSRVYKKTCELCDWLNCFIPGAQTEERQCIHQVNKSNVKRMADDFVYLKKMKYLHNENNYLHKSN